jgi:hypothetical protein
LVAIAVRSEKILCTVIHGIHERAQVEEVTDAFKRV